MHDLLLLIILLTPSVFIAFKSSEGDKTGYFIFYAWLAGSLMYGLLGLMFFSIGIAFFILISFIYRKNLDIQRWFKKK